MRLFYQRCLTDTIVQLLRLFHRNFIRTVILHHSIVDEVSFSHLSILILTIFPILRPSIC